MVIKEVGKAVTLRTSILRPIFLRPIPATPISNWEASGNLFRSPHLASPGRDGSQEVFLEEAGLTMAQIEREPQGRRKGMDSVLW